MNQTVSASSRVWNKVRRHEEEPPNDGADSGMMGGGSKPSSFRDAVINSKMDSADMEDE